MKKSLIIAAASVFAAGTIATVAHADVKCGGLNACKGMSACKTGASSCKGMNACKGQGWVESGNTLECQAQGGKVL